MATSVFDSALFRNMFGTEEMRAVFPDAAWLERCIEAETALARAQAKAGLFPLEAAQTISERSQFAKLDLDELGWAEPLCAI